MFKDVAYVRLLIGKRLETIEVHIISFHILGIKT